MLSEGPPFFTTASAEPYASPDANENSGTAFDPSLIDWSNASPTDARLMLIGNPFNRRLIKEHERMTGQDWPVDPKTGRKYDVAHIRALADGGTNTVDNIRPMHPADHMAEHIENDDYSRWGRRPAIARAFGGTVVRGMGPLSFLSNLLGLASGRIRKDTPENFWADMLGVPSQNDLGWQYGDQRQNPNYKPPEIAL